MLPLLVQAPDSLNTNEIAEQIAIWNEFYRKGQSTVSDQTFDAYEAELRLREPTHPLITSVPVEPLSGNKIIHSQSMLSTSKAYEISEIITFLSKIIEAGNEVGISSPTIRISPKLDGVAGRRETKSGMTTLATRGNGLVGNNISSLLDKGLVVVSSHNKDGAGEVIISEPYFQKHLAPKFKNSRNFTSGLVNADTLNADAEKALKDGAVKFIMFDSLELMIELTAEEVMADIEALEQCIIDSTTEYMIDGVIFEATDSDIKTHLGSASNYHRYMVAKKRVGKPVEVEVINIHFFFFFSGAISPVLEIEPTEIGGVVISKVTAHHCGYVRDKRIGIGSIIECERAGSVIPKVVSIKTQKKPEIPTYCPCCNTELQWQNDSLRCCNLQCYARIESLIIHHFKTLKCLGFGEKIVESLVNGGCDCIEKIYHLTHADMVACGIGNGVAKNLLNEIARVKSEPLGDELLVASLGVSNLGRRAATRLLTEFDITELSSVTAKQMQQIEGFGERNSSQIVIDLWEKRATFSQLLDQGFTLIHTKQALLEQQAIAESSNSKWAGKQVVITGKCRLSREEMAKDLAGKGCIFQKNINAKTDILLVGDNVGQVKINAAKSKGVLVLSEEEYFSES